MAERWRPPLKKIRVVITVTGTVLSDEEVETYSVWRAVHEALVANEYQHTLKDTFDVEGWLTYQCPDGFVVQAKENDHDCTSKVGGAE